MSKESDALEVPVFKHTYSDKQKVEKAELEKGLGCPIEVLMAVALFLYDEHKNNKDKSEEDEK